MNKQAIVSALLAQLEDEIARATDAANRTREGATHEEARPENDKDTRALEASYLARGQAQRVVDLESDRKRLAFMQLRKFDAQTPIDLSALIQLHDEDDTTRWYFLAIAGGGKRIEHEGQHIDVLTPEAPLGRALAGRVRGEDVQLRIGAKLRELSIAEVR
jgi:hypothetical protein